MGALGMAISNLGSMLPARTPAIQGSWGALMDQAKSAGLKAGADRAGVAPQPEAMTNAAPAAPPMRGARRRAPSFGGGMGF